MPRRTRPPGERRVPPKLDPVLPLPAGYEIPDVKQGDSDKIFADTRTFVVELPYRALYMLWENAERTAARDYPKYKNLTGAMGNAAKARLEAVHALRSAVHNNGDPIRVYDKATEEKIRSARTKYEALMKRLRTEARSKIKRKQGEEDYEYAARIEEAAQKAFSEGRTGSRAQEGAQADETPENEAQPVRKKRCRETYDADPANRCLGPDNGHKRHRDRAGNRWIT